MIHIFLIISHFIFDWVLQPRHIARAKGRSKAGINAVLQHLLLNILPFSAVFFVLLIAYDYEFLPALWIVFVNFVAHGIIDIFLPKGVTERQIINWTAVDQILHISFMFALL